MFNLSYRTYFYKFDDIYIRGESLFYNRYRVEKYDINRYVEIFDYLAAVIRKSIYHFRRVK